MTTVMRRVGGLVMAAAVMISGATAAFAQTSAVQLTADLPEGVTFAVIAQSDVPTVRPEVLQIERIAIDCGEATGRQSASEQLVYVEWGEVAVYDWGTGEIVETLTAGETYETSIADTDISLLALAGHDAQVIRLTTAADEGTSAELPDVAIAETACTNGVTGELPVALAATDVLLSQEVAGYHDPIKGPALRSFYIGELTVAPGAALGRPYAPAISAEAYVSNGYGAIVPVIGSFGDGSTGMMGIVQPEIPTGLLQPFGQGETITWENFGEQETVALIFGVVLQGTLILNPRIV